MARRAPILLVLISWLLLGYGVPRPRGGEDRVLSSLSFVDATSNPANRVDASRDVLRSLVAAKRSTRPPVRLVSPLAAAWLAALERPCLHHETGAHAETRWRAPRPKRLTVPHNANAPPLRRS